MQILLIGFWTSLKIDYSRKIRTFNWLKYQEIEILTNLFLTLAKNATKNINFLYYINKKNSIAISKIIYS